MSKDVVEVTEGQVYQDQDTRMGGRKIKVLYVSQLDKWAEVENLSGAHAGLRRRISLSRLQKTWKYKLVTPTTTEIVTPVSTPELGTPVVA